MALKIIKLTQENYQKALSSAEKVLKGGGIVVGPSDTVYGVYASAFDKKAVKKIFQFKKRSLEKALPLFVKDIQRARKLAYIDDRKAGFLNKVWPGPVTVVFYKKDIISDLVSGGKETAGFRVPDYVFLADLMGRVDFPIAQTSANISGNEPIRSFEEAKELWKNEKLIDLMLDGGELAKQSSTVIDFSHNEPIILRSGVITKKELDEALGR
ncbi:MAG: L-threonylcarbamoyladenylate synthase [bacterium]|nr:L-threonylcarbamoyladenylate synthase [bacterium]